MTSFYQKNSPFLYSLRSKVRPPQTLPRGRKWLRLGPPLTPPRGRKGLRLSNWKVANANAKAKGGK